MQASSANASQIGIAVDTGDREPLSGKEARQSGQPKGAGGEETEFESIYTYQHTKDGMHTNI